MTKTMKIDDEVHARLATYGRKDQTFSDVITELLGETKLLPELKQTLETSNEKSETARKEGKAGLMKQAYDALNSACRKFIADVESR